MARKEPGFVPWMFLFFFGLCAAVFVAQLLPGASYLRLHGEGFDVCSLYRKWPTIRWESTSYFRVTRLPPVGHALVVFDAEGLGKETLQAINRGLTGAAAGLPDTYGMKPQELADLMNAWRSRNLFPIRQ
jgi:hypothetical protein